MAKSRSTRRHRSRSTKRSRSHSRKHSTHKKSRSRSRSRSSSRGIHRYKRTSKCGSRTSRALCGSVPYCSWVKRRGCRSRKGMKQGAVYEGPVNIYG